MVEKGKGTKKILGLQGENMVRIDKTGLRRKRSELSEDEKEALLVLQAAMGYIKGTHHRPVCNSMDALERAMFACGINSHWLEIFQNDK